MDTSVELAVRERFGNVALDFTNTVVRGRGGPVDALQHPRQLLEWLTLVAAPGCPELLPGSLPGLKTLFDEALRLRADIHRLFAVVSTGHDIPPAVVFGVNRALAAAHTSTRLDVSEEGPRLTLQYGAHGPAGVLTPIALAASELVVGVEPKRLRQCQADDCIRWFVDTSKGGRRHWCSMATCGNRAKAARYRASAGRSPER